VVCEKQPDIILLQEVTFELRNLLLAQKVFQDYWIAYKDFVPAGFPRRHGLMTLSKFKPKTIDLLELPSNKNRKCIVLYAQTSSGESIAIANFHLESPIEDSHIRAQQMEVIQKATSQCKYVVLAGDSNMITTDENNCLSNKYMDMFIVLKAIHLIDKNDRGLTFDLETNLMGRHVCGFIQTSRLDRVFLFSFQCRASFTSSCWKRTHSTRIVDIRSFWSIW